MQLRERLINELSPHVAEKPTHEIILLARRCKVKEWLVDAYTNLVREKSSVDLLGLRNKEIDADTIASLFFIREQTGFRPRNPTSSITLNCGHAFDPNYCRYCGYSQGGPDPTIGDVVNKINEIFASELAVMVSNQYHPLDWNNVTDCPVLLFFFFALILNLHNLSVKHVRRFCQKWKFSITGYSTYMTTIDTGP
jgi:hypothetical protein